MQLNKIDTDFKNKLNQREIKPSHEAWDRLDAMLTFAEEKKPKRKYPWFYIAASIVVFLSIGIGFFTQNDKAIDVKNNEVVIENIDNKNKPTQEKIKSIIPITINSEKAIVISDVKKVKSIKEEKQVVIPIEKKTIITNQNQIVENSINNSKNEQQSITLKTPEAVIAELPIKIEKPLKKSTIKVDAKSLLSEVDGELELTFRESALDKLNKNFKAVKTVLVNRNYQE